jgi:hypothetical protein
MASRTPSSPRPDHRRGLVWVALAVGVMIAVTRMERDSAYLIPGVSLLLAPWMPAEAGAPATAAAERVMGAIEDVESRMRGSRYRHEIEVNEELGLYDFDESGWAAWVLQRAAPLAFTQLGRERPVAEDFARVIHAAPTDGELLGWRRLTHPSALRPGDVLAWSTPMDHRRDGLTGRVLLCAGMPVRIPGLDEAWSVEVSDATNEFHQLDSRMMRFDLDGGVGRGTITLAVAEDGHPYAYGWQGPWSPVFLRTDVELGRVTE